MWWDIKPEKHGLAVCVRVSGHRGEEPLFTDNVSPAMARALGQALMAMASMAEETNSKLKEGE